MTSERARALPRLWLVTDGERGSAGRALDAVVAQAYAGGVDAVIVRERGAPTRALVSLVGAIAPLRAGGLRVLLSRRIDLVRALDLDGVHLAADAVPVARARAWLGPHKWIGYSAHDAGEAAQVAADGADYVTLSPIYATDSKPGLPGRGLPWLRDAVAEVPVPVVALGGVTPRRTKEILQTGAWGVAAVSAIGAAPDVARAARCFRTQLGETAG